MKIYTRTGDGGKTSLAGGKRVPKSHPKIEACGNVDELISWIGLLKDFQENMDRRKIFLYIQDQLMRCAFVLASEQIKDKKVLPDKDCVKMLEDEIDKMELSLQPLQNFILPGGNIVVSYCHIARCVCRRAERAVARLDSVDEVPDLIKKFLNRLADYLFMLSRFIGLELGIHEIKWTV